jgi:lipopolysaccharide transport system ATP-binding protein
MGTIDVQNLGKAYKQYPHRWSRLLEWLSPKHTSRHTLRWVLKDISFKVNPGEALGIIGVNGAGKSTLLKTITGTTQPTIGTVKITGRVSAILELGMGFHPDFTGRQNALMAGQLLGYDVKEIVRLMPEIESFAEIGDYIDEPVRVYSSGMQVRLAFAVATAIRPDILIVDEALSVGDSFFQHKCMKRIRGFRDQGTTLLFVSHSDDAIRMLCQKAIMLADGKIAMAGDAASVMDFYRASQVQRMNTATDRDLEISNLAPTVENRSGKAVLANKNNGAISVELLGDGSTIYSGQDLSIRISVGFNEYRSDPHIGFGIRNKMGVVIYEANTYTLKHATRPINSGEQLSVTFSFVCRLAPGTYEIMIGVANSGYDLGSFEQALLFDQSFIVFEVVLGTNSGWGGLCDLEPTVTIG